LNDYKWSSFNVYLANRTFLVGAGYIPAYNGLNVTGAFKLAKFKR